jgi:hypothetical protein
MMRFIGDSAFLAQHAPDADYRKDYDDTTLTAEATRHYIDIDDYPDYGNLPRDFGAVAALYGWTRAKENGVLPWAAGWTYDSLVARLRRGDWNASLQSAADLGHYVADAHQPLHTTKNYDGRYSGNDGIHYRYESVMLNARHYLPSLTVTPDSVRRVADPVEYMFEIVLRSVEFVDTILHADDLAKLDAGWDGVGTAPESYYDALWKRTRSMTLDQIQLAAQAVANLWYSAWLDAGLIHAYEAGNMFARPEDFGFISVSPNPASASVLVRYSMPAAGGVTMELYTLSGARVMRMENGLLPAGAHTLSFASHDLPEGAYLLLLRSGPLSDIAKLLVTSRVMNR